MCDSDLPKAFESFTLAADLLPSLNSKRSVNTPAKSEMSGSTAKAVQADEAPYPPTAKEKPTPDDTSDEGTDTVETGGGGACENAEVDD